MSLNLPVEDLNLYRDLLEIAGEKKLFIVGGYVRDLLLNTPTVDLDFMLERELNEFLESLVKKFKATFVSSRFFTAKLNFIARHFGHTTLDFSQARKETYPLPASRPEVSPGTISQDLSRRDFTINSIAILKDEFLDPSNGRNDLSSKLIRVHHQNSFRDDPIRLVRAIRFASRFDFNLEKNTAAYFEDAKEKNYLSLVSPRRRFEELKKVLSEPKREWIISRLHEEKLLNVLCPAIVTEIPVLSNELDFSNALLKLVEPTSSVWHQYVDSLGLPKEESRNLKLAS